MLPRMLNMLTLKNLDGLLFEEWGHSLLFSECMLTLTHADLEQLRFVAVLVSKA